ncbi:hypothetical protein LZC95_43310 [Pendulispora brunnea]|uniref:Uncharacterized protein n=1 Tax=Pendulispora brunnea TaxID=2905690 RepID=A0ABZ2K3H8_9BACT
MRDADDARYGELLRALTLGGCPGWIKEAQRAQLELLSDRHRLAIASPLGTTFQHLTFYATAFYGPAFLEGVTRSFVDQPPEDASFSLKVARAAKAWIEATGRRELAMLFEYEQCLSDPGEPYTGEDREALQLAERLPDGFSLVSFDCDILGFAGLLERLRARSAPPEMVVQYQPAPRRQRLAFYREGEALRVQELSAG